MKNHFWLIALLFPFFGFSQDKTTEPLVQQIEEFEGGKIDWTNQYIEVSGISIQNHDKYKNATQCLEMAKRGAMIVAKANLLEITEGIKVSRSTTVEDLMTTGDLIKAELEGVVKGARQIGKAKVEEDVVTVTVRMSLVSSGGLAPLIHEKLEQKKNRERVGSTETAPSEDIKVDAEDAKKEFVLNFKDKKFDPSLFPVIVDEDGNVIVDYADLYKKYGGNIVKYVKIAEDIMPKDWKKGKEIIDAIQNPDGSIKVDTQKYPKFKKILKSAWKIGKVALPILLGML